MRFPLAAAYRRVGPPREAEHALAGFRHGPHDVWWSCAEGENWLTQPKGVPPKGVWRCAAAAERPKLDGALDDPAWKQAAPIELHSAQRDDVDWPATAQLAYDQEFLYLALRCRQAAGVEYPPAEGTRPRQADLSACDHVDLLLSPDRDYATYFRLSIDHRGWVNTGLSGGAQWQPTCYVAAANHNGEWTIEAAIPWSQLSGGPPPADSRQPWCVNIQRTVPSVGFQSWSTPAAIEIRPEGMGFLMFERPAPVKEAKSSER